MPSFEINPAHIMKDVYSYPFPEVRRHIDALHLPAAFMLNTLRREDAADMLLDYGLSPALTLPETPEGTLDLDELHVPVIERITARNEHMLPGLQAFDHAYPHHGSSQAIFTLMAEWKAKDSLRSIAVREGEYDGYKAYAESLNVPVRTYSSLNEASPNQDETWFISNPSALDGNWINESSWADFVAQGHDIVLDAAYAGLTPAQSLDVTAPNIRAVLTSPSKIFGVFRYRNTGIAYTREPVSAMYSTKWFKDIPALLTTLSLYETFGPSELADIHRPTQELLCQKLSEACDATINPSDVLLLGATTETPKTPYDAFTRGHGFRFGLTKLFEDIEFAGLAQNAPESV